MTVDTSADSPNSPRLQLHEWDDAPDVQAKVVRYKRPEVTRSRHVMKLGRTAALMVNLQFITKGGESTLHAHPNMDGWWFVLKGRARFYTTDDEVVADLGPHDGILIPRDYPYWFENSSDEELELLQVEAFKEGEPVKTLRYGKDKPVEWSSTTKSDNP